MNGETALNIHQKTRGASKLMGARGLLDILVAFIPIVVFGGAGTILGTGTQAGGALVNLGYVLSILVAGFVLKMRGIGWREVGLARPLSWRRTALLGLGTLLLSLAVFVAVQVVALNLPGAQVASVDQSRFNPLAGNLPLLCLYVVLAWSTIGFGEEMFYRAFMMNRLDEVFQKLNHGSAFSLVVSTLVFGFIHFAEGPLGIVNAAVFGLVLGAVYLRSGRNLWVTIIAHGLANTIRFILLYLGAG